MTSLNDVLLAMSNVPVDDPIAEIWGRGLQGGGYTVRKYTGTLPITINANGQPLLDYQISGNTEQTGTPTPENPIMPIGCGVMTENLLAANSTSATVNTVTISNDNGKITVTGRASSEITSTNLAWKNAFTFRLKAGSYYFAAAAGGGVSSYLRNANDDTHISMPNSSFVLSNDTDVYIGFWVYNNKDMTFNIMLNLGSTALPYEPYGYKLPILSNSTVTNIYLGEVETTRRIKKLVLTGEEEFNKNTATSSNYLYYKPRKALLPNSIEKTPLICNELPVTNEAPVSQIGISSNNDFNVIYVNFGADVMNTQPSGNTADGLKEYLAAQYASGTPVTIWYVLAEPETGIVNEPLMKIDKYADTVSMEQAGVSIPTIKGTTVIDYDGTPKPSEMYIKYGGKK